MPDVVQIKVSLSVDDDRGARRLAKTNGEPTGTWARRVILFYLRQAESGRIGPTLQASDASPANLNRWLELGERYQGPFGCSVKVWLSREDVQRVDHGAALFGCSRSTFCRLMLKAHLSRARHDGRHERPMTPFAGR